MAWNKSDLIAITGVGVAVVGVIMAIPVVVEKLHLGPSPSESQVGSGSDVGASAPSKSKTNEAAVPPSGNATDLLKPLISRLKGTWHSSGALVIKLVENSLDGTCSVELKYTASIALSDYDSLTQTLTGTAEFSSNAENRLSPSSPDRAADLERICEERKLQDPWLQPGHAEKKGAVSVKAIDPLIVLDFDATECRHDGDACDNRELSDHNVPIFSVNTSTFKLSRNTNFELVFSRR